MNNCFVVLVLVFLVSSFLISANSVFALTFDDIQNFFTTILNGGLPQSYTGNAPLAGANEGGSPMLTLLKINEGGTTTTSRITTTTSSTTTTAPPGTFTGSNFNCVGVSGGFNCGINYNNNLGENAVILFLFSNSSGNLLSQAASIAQQGSGSLGALFYCSVVPSGAYNVSWKAYKQSDSGLTNPVAFSSTTSTQYISCGAIISTTTFTTSLTSTITTTTTPPITCKLGTVYANYGLSIGTYTIYSDLANNGAWAKIIIKSSNGNTLETKVINQGDEFDFVAEGLTIRVINARALQDGTVVGVDISAGPIGPCPYVNYVGTRNDIPGTWNFRSDWHYASTTVGSLTCADVVNALKSQQGSDNVANDCLYGSGVYVLDFKMSSPLNVSGAYLVLSNALNNIVSSNPSSSVNYVNFWSSNGNPYAVNFKAGWNLFSVPVSYVASSTTDCVPTSPIYGMNDGNYYQTTSTVGGNGYWLQMTSDCQIYVTGTNVTTDNFPILNAGWNLIGAPSLPTLFSSMVGTCNVTSGPYWYDPASNSYVKSSTLDPGKGYFLKVDSSCQFGSGLPPPPPQ